MSAGEPLLHVTGLEVAYGHVEAVRGVSLSVAEGQFVTLIGPNGAGKTSLLSALAGLVRPRIARPSGTSARPAATARWAGRPVTSSPPRSTAPPAAVGEDPAVIAAYLGAQR